MLHEKEKGRPPPLRVCPPAEPMENGVLCEHILIIEISHYLREQLHQLCILIALNLDLVNEF